MSYATTSTKSERLQREIDEAIAAGWKIETETPERVVLVKRNFGDLGVHLILAVLTAWWSFGLVNLAYGAYKYVNDSKRRVLRDTTACPECGSSVPVGASYCQNCGTEVAGVSSGVGAMSVTETGAATETGAETGVTTETGATTETGPRTETGTGTGSETDPDADER